MEYYRVQERYMSPDVVEKNISTNPNKPKWIVYIAPIGSRFNMEAHYICDMLNQRENELNLNC